MNSRLSTARATQHAGAGWDFGGFAYGLEPLVLPSAGTLPSSVANPDSIDGAVSAAYGETCARIRQLADGDAVATDVQRCDEPEQLFWFRWITGHQLCMVVWRLMARLLDDVRQGRLTADDAVEPMCHFVYGYTTMLLYTGSCPQDVYHGLIRPSMRLRHPGFSGGWAPDYWPIRDLVRGREPAMLRTADAGWLVDALDLNRRVHDGVAAKLVPDGRSLLRQASVRCLDHRMAGMIYDSYFMTARVPVSRHDVVTQLLRRLVAIAHDIAANGLCPYEDADERPAELCTAGVLRCEDDLGGILFEVARQACGLGPAGPDGSRPTDRRSATEVGA